MNKYYLKIILDKMKKLPIDKLESDIGFYNDKVSKITWQIDKYSKIVISEETYKFKIQFFTGVRVIDGEVRFPFKIFLFSSLWFKWKKICKKIEKEHRLKKKLEKQKESEKNKAQLDETMTTMFPDLIERELFGDDDDK